VAEMQHYESESEAFVSQLLDVTRLLKNNKAE